MANVPINSINFPGQDDTYTFLQNDTTLTTSGKAADARIAGNNIAAIYGCINTTNHFVNYGYGNEFVEAEPESIYGYLHIGVEKNGTQVKLNGSNTSYATWIKISGTVDRKINNAGVDTWNTGIVLKPGHTYRASAVFISGTVTKTGDNYPSIFVVKTEAHSSLGTKTMDGITAYRTFTADSDEVNIGLYVYAQTTFTNAVYQIILEDLTETNVLESPNGTKYRLVVANDGTLSTEQVVSV